MAIELFLGNLVILIIGRSSGFFLGSFLLLLRGMMEAEHLAGRGCCLR